MIVKIKVGHLSEGRRMDLFGRLTFDLKGAGLFSLFPQGAICLDRSVPARPVECNTIEVSHTRFSSEDDELAKQEERVIKVIERTVTLLGWECRFCLDDGLLTEEISAPT